MLRAVELQKSFGKRVVVRDVTLQVEAGEHVALLGHNLQATFQHPAVLIGFSVVFVLLALAMFGFYELQVPSRLQSRLTELSNRQEGGTLTGVAIMGLLSALIVGPCVAPPLAGADTGDDKQLIAESGSGDPDAAPSAEEAAMRVVER